jgi:hypothetical protein
MNPFRVLLTLPLLVAFQSAGYATPQFTKQILTDQYYCDGINAGDINGDGHLDVVAGPFWYEGPELKEAHAFYPPESFELPPSPTNSMFSYVYDFDSDGWQDILVFGRVHKHEAYWYQNPGKESVENKEQSWEKHFVFFRIQGESPPFMDVDGDGRPEIVSHWENYWGLIKPDPNYPTLPWKFYPFSEKGSWDKFYHGTGVGDINGDNRLDIILTEGWYEQPARKGGSWKKHAYEFIDVDLGGAQMFAYDVDGDGDNDVVTALDGHGWGFAWFEQIPGKKRGTLTFRKHIIMGSRDEEAKYGVAFSQPHAVEMADMDGDGLMDIITGKRRWAHGPEGDVEPNAAPVIYWFQLERTQGGSARFHPRLIDDWSGLGVQITVKDVNNDNRPDVLAASKLGSFVFFNRAD